MLICPVCKKALNKKEKEYICEGNHHFDIAKQGYCNLYLKSSKVSGDNKEMVVARNEFLSKGYYEPLAKKIVSILQEINHEVIVDAGCGEGYYTNYIKQQLNTKIYGFDLSKDALKIASRNNKLNQYFVNSIFDLPIQSESIDVALNIFAPFAQEEFQRIIKKDGYVIKVDPNIKHLQQLKEELYEQSYDNEILSIQSDCYTLIKHEEIEFDMHLKQEDIKCLLMMTPYYYKSKKEAIERLCNLQTLVCKASFIIYVYQNK